MMDNATYRRLKSRLTRAEHSGDPRKVLAETRYAFDIFEDDGYPDGWARWDNARRDAEYAIGSGGGGWWSGDDIDDFGGAL